MRDGFNSYLIEDDIFPIKDNSYDSLLMDNVIEHIEDPLKILSGCSRVLKKKGIFVLGTPGLKGYQIYDDHKIYYDEKKLINLLRSLNFEHKKTIYKSFKFRYFDKLLRQYCMYTVFSNNKN